jgi:nucleoside-diphosphate-sugar epimerase
VRSALVAGATGFVGTNLVRSLLDAGVTTYGLARTGSPNRSRLERLDGFHSIPIDSYGTAELERALGAAEVDVVYSAVGSGTSHAEDRWEVLLDGNIRTATDMARFAAGRARRFVHVGTCLEYAAKDSSLVESDPMGPTSAYATTKAAAQLLIAHLCRSAGLEHVHARLFNTYGLFEGRNRLIPFLLRQLRAGEPALLTAGTHVRDFTFVTDVTDALVRLGDCPLEEGRGVFNVCTGRGISVREVAERVADVVGFSPALLRFGARPERADEPRRIVGSSARLRERTGWTPAVDLTHGIALMARAADESASGSS